MEYRNLGSAGLKVSRLCLGCMSFGDPQRGNHEWTLDEQNSRAIIRQALESGINFFDTANAYSDGTSEEIIGRALRDFARRDEIVVASKGFFAWRNAPNTGGLSRKALFQAVDDSLERLGLDYLDLYQIHRWDDATPIEETMEALHDIVKSGKVRYIGASSMSAWQFSKAQYIAQMHGWTKFISMQNQVNLIYREEEREMLPLCADMGVGVIPWSPLARGRLTRDWAQTTARSETDRLQKAIYAGMEAQDRQVIEEVSRVAIARDVKRAQVAMAWLLQKPGITSPIIGVTQASHLIDALGALELTLAPEEVAALEAPYVPHPVAGVQIGSQAPAACLSVK
ncbi:aldo/keto reductase [Acidocella sp.]|uniref:aldo/keto reductase n=1 Tax=Acidocella sp. TaxID=50710 RepID=UPI0026323240|nr:aldo/keto reductase [Acidocella sp.]